MRGLRRKLPIPSPLLPSSSLLPYSTFSGGGGGRGRGRGFGVPPPPPSSDDHDPPSVPSLGHGRGRGATTSSGGPILSSFPSFVAPSPSLGRGQPQPPPPANPNPKTPIFFTRDKTQFADPDGESTKTPSGGPHQPLPSLPGAGRGKAHAAPAPKPAETNRHARPRQPIGAKPSAGPAEGPRLSQEEAVKKAVEVLMRGETGGGRGRGRGVRGRDGGRGRGRGGWRGGRGRRDADDEFELYVGDNADGEKFVKRMGEERMKVIEEAFEEMSSRVLPSPVEDAYLDALHTNNLVKCTLFKLFVFFTD